MKGMDTTTIVCIKHTSGVYFMKINERRGWRSKINTKVNEIKNVKCCVK